MEYYRFNLINFSYFSFKILIYLGIIKDTSEKHVINRDPGAYVDRHKFSDDDLRYLVSKRPFQPRIDFPVNERHKLLNETCKFVPS